MEEEILVEKMILGEILEVREDENLVEKVDEIFGMVSSLMED